MSKQTEDLVCVHLDVDALYGMQSVLVDFLQAGDLQKLLIPFLILDLWIKLFVAFWVHQGSLKLLNLFNVFIIAFAAFILLKYGIDGFTTAGVIHSSSEGYALTNQTVLLFITVYRYDLADASCFHGVLERIRAVLCSVFLLAAAPEL